MQNYMFEQERSISELAQQQNELEKLKFSLSKFERTNNTKRKSSGKKRKGKRSRSQRKIRNSLKKSNINSMVMENELDSLVRQITFLQGENKRLSQHNMELLTNFGHYEGTMTSAEKRIQLLEHEIKELNTTINIKDLQIEDTLNENKQLRLTTLGMDNLVQSTNEEHIVQTRNLQRLLENMGNQNQHFKEIIKVSKMQSGSQEEEIVRLNTVADSYKRMNENLKKQVKKLKQKCSMKKDHILDLQTNLMKAENAKTSLQQTVLQQEEQILLLGKDVQQLRVLLSQQKNNNVTLSVQNNDLCQTIKDLQADNFSLNHQLQESNQAQQNLITQGNELQQILDQYKQMNDNLKEQVSTLNYGIDTKKDHILKLQSQLKEENNAKLLLQNTCDAQKGKILKLDSELQKFTIMLNSVNNNLEAERNTTAHLKAQGTQLAKDCQTLESGLMLKEREKVELQSNVKVLEDRYVGLKNDVSQLSVHLNQQNNNLVQSKNRVMSLQAQNTELQKNVQGLHHDNIQLNQTLKESNFANETMMKQTQDLQSLMSATQFENEKIKTIADQKMFENQNLQSQIQVMSTYPMPLVKSIDPVLVKSQLSSRSISNPSLLNPISFIPPPNPNRFLYPSRIIPGVPLSNIRSSYVDMARSKKLS